MKYLTKSDKETVMLGKGLGSLLNTGDVIALFGNLGSGKTWFTKGLALGLGFGESTVITSPSFAIVNEYHGRQTIYHMDLYRLDSESEFLATGLDEYFEANGILIMEWADRWPEILPEQRIEVYFKIIDDNKREIDLHGYHRHSADILDKLNDYFKEKKSPTTIDS